MGGLTKEYVIRRVLMFFLTVWLGSTLIFIIPPGFNDLQRYCKVSNGLAICSNTCSVLMRSNSYSEISSHLIAEIPDALA